MKLRIQNNQMEEVEGMHSAYPYAFHHVHLSTTEVPWHWHEALEFNLVVEGSVKVCTVTQAQVFHKGQGFFINSNVLASMENIENCVLDSHLFHPVFLSGHFKSVFETKYINPVTQNRNMELICLQGESSQQKQILGKLRQLSRLQSEADAEFQTPLVDLANQIGQAAGEFLFVDKPVTQGGGVVVADAEPAIVHDQHLHTQLSGFVSEGHQLVRIKVEQGAFPGVDQQGPLGVFVRSTDQVVVVEPMENAAHFAHTLVSVDHDCLGGVEGLAGF